LEEGEGQEEKESRTRGRPPLEGMVPSLTRRRGGGSRQSEGGEEASSVAFWKKNGYPNVAREREKERGKFYYVKPRGEFGN